jgi:peptidoglycan/xylan/chitin deacetylase (PgdA/CDA1 family)
MNLVSFSIRTKGLHNFTRRLWTVFTRFGFTEVRIRRALYALIETLRAYGTAPTFFIPAVVLRRHPELITKVSYGGAEIGIHGYVHNDYRLLSEHEQYEQTQQAISVFRSTQLPYQGFRNPYLGWTEESLRVFNALGFVYESNEAVIHDVIDQENLSPIIKSGYEKSLALFQAIPPGAYTLRPHFEGALLRIPTSIPDDEMLFDRLRITNPYEIGHIWCKIMKGVYDHGGLFALNLHPERGIYCRQALDTLLSYARNLPRGVWLARLDEVAQWWKERSQFSLSIAPLSSGYWLVEANCSPRATLFARHLTVDYQSPTAMSSNVTDFVCRHRCIVQATKHPCLALSPQTPLPVMDFLLGQGYPVVRCSQEEADKYGLYLDIPEGLGETRSEQLQRRSALLQRIEQAEIPLLYFGAWPDNNLAALSISGDIDSVTIQDFFLRILEVYRSKDA